MPDHDQNIDQLVAQIATKHKQTVKWSMMLALIFLLLGAAWLLYSLYQVNKWRLEVDKLKAEETLLKEKIELNKATVKEAEEYLDVLKNRLNSNLVTQSLEANGEVRNFTKKGNVTSNQVTLLYYVKEADAGRVQAALSEVGFNVRLAEPKRPDLPTNSIGYGKNVALNDVKLAVFVLIRAGIEIKDVCRSTNDRMASIIQVLGDARILRKPPLTVEQVREHKEFGPCRTV